jgi:pimeloyl-ACP methyl ester carboxylesterase
MPTIPSADGTPIAYERGGSGPALILVDGAMCYRGAGPVRPIAERLHAHFTVYAYDRRGRGESGDTAPYAVSREVEDLRALIAEAGGTAYAFGISSGAALVLAAAAAGVGLAKVALYEPPFTASASPEDALRAKDYTERLAELLSDGRRGDTVALFMSHVGVPAPAIEHTRRQPAWAALEAIAPTLAYDDALLGGGAVPRELAAAVPVPALVLSGGASPPMLRDAARATADALPGGRHRVLDGQTHDVSADAVAPVLIEFFGAA